MQPSGVGGIGSKRHDHHRRRQAMGYVRQAHPQPGVEHVESTARHYALVKRAVAYGWLPERVMVIDEAQGQSGQSMATRVGFQRLLAEVSLDHVGVILGLELSRLARSNTDWHQRRERCAIVGTLLAEADGLYDPTDDHDRLLLGLRGMRHEAELSMLKGRMHEGRRHQAKRGERLNHPPRGYGRGSDGDDQLDPDEPARRVVGLLVDVFAPQGSGHGWWRSGVAPEIGLPIRPHRGVNRGQLAWPRPKRMTWPNVRHHPSDAGAYRWGSRKVDRRQQQPGRPTTGRTGQALESCEVRIKARVPAYSSWERCESIQQRLANHRSMAQAQGAPREGPSLVGGVRRCRRCRRRLLPASSGKANRLRYTGTRAPIDDGSPGGRSLSGTFLDAFVVEQRRAVLEPAAVEWSSAAEQVLRAERAQLELPGQQR